MTDIRIDIAPLGDSAVLVTLGHVIDSSVTRRVHRQVAAVRAAALRGVVDVAPAYASFAVHYDPRVVEITEVVAALDQITRDDSARPLPRAEGRLIRIPVRYDGADLSEVSTATGLTVEDVITRHLAVEYFVYMLGFAPGFSYMGDLDTALHLPRRESPRARVPRGAVAIAGAQTAVYPHETPGGWHLIGSTAMSMFDARRNPPATLRAGDRVRFERVA